ncbi:MAG: glycoside hydrolase family 65 protein, partial [Candidatus Izimaplasma sp.]|nr:glycoside hydrolase family 65 protein [Candidatus Izimaplasma bacterium]
LLLNYHPLYLYKHQVIKQADTMLSMMLLDYDELSILSDSFNYYEPITTHDSSLSECIHSVLAFKLKKFDMACEYFMKVLNTDYLNSHNNTQHGLHVANLGGAYIGFIYGLLGLRIKKDRLLIYPVKTPKIMKYELNVMYQGNIINIKVDNDLVISGEGNVSLEVYGERIILNGTYRRALKT